MSVEKTYTAADGSEHTIQRYIATGALSGEMRAAWRCSCEGGRHCGVFDDQKSEWMFGASPERHLENVGADR